MCSIRSIIRKSQIEAAVRGSGLNRLHLPVPDSGYQHATGMQADLLPLAVNHVGECALVLYRREILDKQNDRAILWNGKPFDPRVKNLGTRGSYGGSLR